MLKHGHQLIVVGVVRGGEEEEFPGKESGIPREE